MEATPDRIQALKDTLFFKRSDFAEGFFERIADVDRWQFLASRFEEFLSSKPGKRAARVPRIIHQIWIGKSLPPVYESWTSGWRKMHPGWEYRLWDEKSILALGLRNEHAFRKSRSFGVKSDIARYEILQKYGGVYVDTDFECLRPLDSIHEECTFYAGTIFADSPVVNNGLLGAAPSHPLILKAIEGLSTPILTRDGTKVLEASGPGYLTKMIFAWQSLLSETDMVFPSSYFYPIPNYKKDAGQDASLRSQYVREWSCAIHFWEASWLKPPAARAFLSKAKRGFLRLLERD